MASIRKRHTGIKRALLDQTQISGVGNIYADESLWGAKLHYARPTETLRRTEIERLLAEIREVMLRALREGGTSFDSMYVNVNGESGYFERSLAVYGQEGEPCSRCGTAIRRDAFMNRSSYTGIQALPKGQRYAGMAVGFTTPQYYRYVILPMAYRIIIPPLTSESMNIFKNSSVAFAVSVTELTMFAMQAQEETSRGIEVYLAVTGLYVISAFAINRIMAFIEKKTRVPGFIVSASGGGGH